MTRPTISTPFAAAVFAVVLTTLSGVLASVFPSDAYPWIAPVVAGITAIAALVRLEFKAPEPPIG